MKKSLKSLMLAALAAVVLFASCNKKEDVNPNLTAGETQGDAAVTRFVLNIAPKTYADETALSSPEFDEVSVNSAAVLVFTSAKTLEKIIPLTSTAGIFSAVSEITVGNKYFYAVINKEVTDVAPTAPSADTRAIVIPLGTSFADIIANYSIDLKDDMEGVYTTNATATPVKIENFVMTNWGEPTALASVVAATQSEAQAGTKNNFVIKVGRAVAKVRASINPTAVQQNGALTAAEFAIRNNPIKTFLLPDFAGTTAAPIPNTPFYMPTVAVADQAKYTSHSSVPVGAAANATATPATNRAEAYRDLVVEPAGPSTTKQFFYAVENTNSGNPLQDNATHIIVKGTWTPAATASFLDGDGVVVEGTAAVAAIAANTGTFYRVSVDGVLTSDIYTAQPTATYLAGITSTPAAEAVAHTNGISYYSIFVADNTKTPNRVLQYAVLRNHLYDIDINLISGPGFPNEIGPHSPVTPGTPVAADTYMRAEILVSPWEYIYQGASM